MENFILHLKYGWTTFAKFVYSNCMKVFVVFIIYIGEISAIGLVNFPYIDDTKRQIDGSTNFGAHYGRWGSEFFSWLFQGSRHLADMGLVNHLLTAIILGTASIVLIFLLNINFNWLSVFATTLLGLNPWFLQCISFRYDSPFMALSLLFSVLPFIWWRTSKKVFYLLTFIGIFLMCNTYQLSSGVFIIVLLGICLEEILHGKKLTSVVKYLSFSAIVYVLAMLLFTIETRLNPLISKRGATVAIASAKDLPRSVARNILVYFETVYSETSKLLLMLFTLIIILFIILSIKTALITRLRALFLIIAYLVLSAVLSYGVLLVFEHPLASWSVRYEYGLAIQFTIILLLLINCINVQKSFMNNLTRAFIAATLYYSLVFPLIYASNLSEQKDSFSYQSMVLTTDLKNYVTDKTQVVYMNKLFNDSPVLINSERNYPILAKLVPSNQNLYWPNVKLFNTQSGLNVDIKPYDFTEFTTEGKKICLKSKLYDIYSLNNDIFVFVK